MKRKNRRLIFVLSGLCVLGLAAALVLVAFEEGIVFFYSPSDLVEQAAPPGRTIRVGGLVEEDSLVRGQGTEVTFRITDLSETVDVSYTGILPDLFREGQGVVAVGMMDPGGRFTATEVLAKHDETYMPKEVVDALKEAGQWQEGESQ